MSRSINEEIGLNGADGTDPVGEPNADMEKPAARLTGVAGRIVAVACVLLSCYAL
jgi:hypothetical protein